jgi:hypothetical protein
MFSFIQQFKNIVKKNGDMCTTLNVDSNLICMDVLYYFKMLKPFFLSPNLVSFIIFRVKQLLKSILVMYLTQLVNGLKRWRHIKKVISKFHC